MKIQCLTFAKRRRNAVIATGLIAILAGALTGILFAQGVRNDAKLLQEAQDAFKPLPQDAATTEYPVSPERVSLGRKLFFDPRISVDGVGSCVKCHPPALYGADGLAKSRGVNDKLMPRNAPTVLNVGLHFKIHWDGGRENVEGQAKMALLGIGFGNPDYATAMSRVRAIPGYTELFEKAFPGEANPVTEDNWGKAIGAYERTLITPSRFDEYLGGKAGTLSAQESRGLRTFLKTGCVQCHDGSGVGGGSFEKFGVVSEYWKETRSKEIDKGRFNITKDDADLYQFKVPSLRNVAMTAPYFHDGSVNSLHEAVRIMGKVQLGVDLTDRDVDEIVAFLGSLTGKLPENFATAPVLPPAPFDANRPASAK